jgi:hypothetical protein
MYVGSAEAPLFKNPTIEFDGVLELLTYGSLLMLVKKSGRWAEVLHGNTTGWILREDLVDRAAYVYPQFRTGETNEAEDPNTLRLRALIEDEYGCGLADLSLMGAEYVHYRLVRKGIHIPWGKQRPRTEGQWQVLLKGKEGLHIGVRPKTGSVMEYEASDHTPHLAFVEAVFPDMTVSTSEIDSSNRGMYIEKVFKETDWQASRAVFLQVS